jgi:Uma2 family endonuclease
MTIAALPIYTIDEYLEMEEQGFAKHDYYNGKIIEMAGGTATHNQISGKIITQLNNVIDASEKPYLVYSSDMKIRIEKNNAFVYPDAVTVALKPEFYNNRRDIITNPLLIVEVTSYSTRAYDQQFKFDHYRTLPSFQEYLLIRQEKHQVTRFFQSEPEVWRITDYTELSAIIPLESMGLSISMEGIYRGVELEA